MAGIPETGIMSSAPPTATASQHLVNNASNTTTAKSLLSSSRDVLTFPFRAVYRADAFAFSTLPRQVARLVGLEGMASQLLENSSGTGEAAVAAGTQAAEAVGDTAAGAAAQDSGFHIVDLFHTLRRLSGFFSYLTSRWSLACFTVVSEVPSSHCAVKSARSNSSRLSF